MNARLVIADDHKMMREGLKSLIESEPGMAVVGEAANGREAVELVRKAAPHIVIMDIAMPDMNGIDAARHIIRENPEIKVIALSGNPDRHLVKEMLRAGASAYVLKQTAYEDLIRAIRDVLKGHTYLSPEVARGIVDTYVRASPKSGDRPAFAALTDREREVLQLLSEGKSTKEIAGALGISAKTVERHRQGVMQRLNIHTVAELTKYAIREGVTSV